MPAESLLAAAPLGDEVVAVIDEQLQLPQERLLGTRPLQAWLAQRHAGDRERVERVGLAAAAAATSFRPGQPRRYPHQAFPGLKQRLFQPAADVTAVLERPQPLLAEAAGPGEEVAGFDSARVLAEPAAKLVDGDRCQRVLVHVHPDHDH